MRRWTAEILIAACLFAVSGLAQPVVYTSEAGNTSLRRLNADGSGLTSIFSGTIGDEPLDIEFDQVNQQVYFSTFAGNIHRSNEAGPPSTIVLPAAGLGAGIALDIPGGKIYWTNNSAPSISRADLSGTNVEVIVPGGLAAPYDIEVDPGAGFIYWSDSSLNTIERANLDGTGRITLWPGLNTPRGIALDLVNQKVLWADPVNLAIYEGNLDGSGSATVRQPTSPAGMVNRIALDTFDGRLYWTDAGSVTAGLYRTDLANPSVPQQIVPGSVNAFEGVALFFTCDPLAPDADGDGTPDCADLCPNDPDKIAPGTCGCGLYDNDPDGSGAIVCGNFPLLTPTTVLTRPPEVISIQRRRVALQLQPFDGATTDGETVSPLTISRAATLTARYAVIARKSDGSRERKVTKRNQVTFRRLKSGTYTARYRAQIVRKNGSVVSQTNRSPGTSFKISR